MRRSAANAAAGVAALSLGFGLMHMGVQRHAPAGHRASSQTISAVPDLSARDDSARFAHEVEMQRLATDRLEAERLEAERLAREEAEAKAQEDRRIARAAAERAEAARKAAVALATPTTVRAAPVARAPVVESSVQSNGSIKARIRGCESGSGPNSPGNYSAENLQGSGASGAFQFLDSTWRGLNAAEGYSRAKHAPPAVQDAAFDELYASSGTTPWNSSRYCWG